MSGALDARLKGEYQQAREILLSNFDKAANEEDEFAIQGVVRELYRTLLLQFQAQEEPEESATPLHIATSCLQLLKGGLARVPEGQRSKIQELIEATLVACRVRFLDEPARRREAARLEGKPKFGAEKRRTKSYEMQT